MSDAPRAIGVIMDGNRRWARARGLPAVEGHRKGLEKLREFVAWAHEAGVTEVTCYAFSTENWNREPQEVAYLMDLLEKTLIDGAVFRDARERNGRVRFIGERSRISGKARELMAALEAETADGDGGTLVIAFSYGGRAEILSAVNRLLAGGARATDETSFGNLMWSAGLLDPDLIIRTGGERRLSNFLTWQSVYSELSFIDTYWPDLSKEEFLSVLSEFASRERRIGK